jgi:hypothetical protein
MPLTADEIRQHVTQDANIEWVPAQDLLADTMESCVDGRSDLGIIGTPGGNAGEFLLCLAVLEQVTGKPFPPEQVAPFFEAYLKAFGKFYMHGDTHALGGLPGDLLDQAPPAETEARRLGNFLRQPPAEVRERLLEELLKPQHIGCGHIKLMLTRPDDYGVRPELILAFMRAFFRALWSGASIDYVVLGGDHQEGAVVNIVVDTEVSNETPIPTITPQVQGKQMFVNHPQAASFLRWNLAQGMDSLTSAKVDPETFHAAIGELAQRQLGHTLAALASGLPIFEIHFKGQDTEPEVTSAGAVA